jgi:hypothetical protein
MAKVVQLGRGDLNHRALLHQILEREGVEAVAIAVRINGKWETCWGGDINSAGLCMAAMKLFRDASAEIEDA